MRTQEEKKRLRHRLGTKYRKLRFPKGFFMHEDPEFIKWDKKKFESLYPGVEYSWKASGEKMLERNEEFKKKHGMSMIEMLARI